MPRRDDLRKILLVGSGPIVIGQACEFDYSGTQGAKALRDEGYEVVLVNSNPATIMTDPEMAVRTYVEPLEPATLRAIIEREKPDAVLPTLGGQTALNLSLTLHENGTLEELGVELIGARPEAITKAESRMKFKELMNEIGLESPRSGYAYSVEEAREIVEGDKVAKGGTGYPAILRASYTLGGTGGGIADQPEELETKVKWALSQSPRGRVLVEESLLGWKEFELEVMRDRADNFIVICTIENIDPMGVHTGDSVTCAPAMTLTDREYQRMRDAARAVISAVGVETGGANVQFAVDPDSGRMVVIEMNPRVSRSSALASKATGYPIAKISAKLAVGYTLDELKNDITGTSAAFEPTIDYVVVKWPRFSFEKFPGADTTLGTQMKSVGEAMAIGRTFPEALEKAARSLERGHDGLGTIRHRVDYRAYRDDPNRARDLLMEGPRAPSLPDDETPPPADEELKPLLHELVKTPHGDRLFIIADALRVGVTVEELFEACKIDPWFLRQLERIIQQERRLAEADELDADLLRESKRLGLSDARIAAARGVEEEVVRAARKTHGLRPTYRNVDTCAAEFPAETPYLYGSYDGPGGAEIPVTDRKKVIILGGGPNRIGQGIEFDYCCVHASFALAELGIESVMVNCNPETVSTDYDTSDRLYFEPLTFEDVLSICEQEKEKGELLGVIVQLGGQTPLKLAVPLAEAGIPMLGTPADAIDRAEDRERFDELLHKLQLQRPPGRIATGPDEAIRVASELGYPVLVRPSYVLGGRAMMICDDEVELKAYMHLAVEAAKEAGNAAILVDKFVDDAIEVDVDAVCDSERVVIGGVMQHIEQAGVHSGDSACVLPPYSLSPALIANLEEQVRQIGLELGVIGLMNVQFAIKGNDVYVLEVNPRAARTIPFVSKSTGRPLAKIAAKVMAGQKLADQHVDDMPMPAHVAVKESVFPFIKFPGVDTQLGPEMRSTGEVMGVSRTFAIAYGKAIRGASVELPRSGTAFISVKDDDKPAACAVARRLRSLGWEIVATEGTLKALERARIPATRVNKVAEGSPHCVDLIKDGKIHVIVNTTRGATSIRDSYAIRRHALMNGLPYFTTMSAALAGCMYLEAIDENPPETLPRVKSLQEWTA